MRSKVKKDQKPLLNSNLLKKCLTECDKGEEVIVLNVDAGPRQKRRLANLGILPGAKIKKKKDAPFRGPLVVIVKGTSLVIGRGLASKITVQCDESYND
jgi:Fe2+ transport system protein FeoA